MFEMRYLVFVSFYVCFLVDSSTEECCFGILALKPHSNIYEWYILSANAFAMMCAFHGTGTVKRKEYTQRFAPERNDFTQQNHPHQHQQQRQRNKHKSLFAATDEPCVVYRRTHNHLNVNRISCHLIFKRIYFAREWINRISEKRKHNMNKDFLLQSEPELTAEHVLY